MNTPTHCIRDFMFQNVATLPLNTTLLTAIRAMSRQKPGFAVVLDNMRLVGLITEYDLLRWMHKGYSLEETVLSKLPLSQPLSVHEDTHCQELLQLYNQRRIRRFPVLNSENILVGGIMEKQIVEAMPRSQLLSHYRVTDVAMSNPPLADPEIPYSIALERMVSLHRGCLLVTKDSRLQGIVTEGDMLRSRLNADWRPDMPLKNFMSTQTTTIDPHQDLLSALDVFQHTHHRRLPIVNNNGILIGLLTQTDVLRRANHAVRSREAILNPEDIPDPAIWVEPHGLHRIQAMNQKGARALQLDAQTWIGRSTSELFSDPDLWPALSIVLKNCGTISHIHLSVQTGLGRSMCMRCRLSLIHTPTGEDRIFWTITDMDSDRGACSV